MLCVVITAKNKYPGIAYLPVSAPLKLVLHFENKVYRDADARAPICPLSQICPLGILEHSFIVAYIP